VLVAVIAVCDNIPLWPRSVRDTTGGMSAGATKNLSEPKPP
jgi:hypothetical protein